MNLLLASNCANFTNKASHLALRWVLQQPGIDTAVVGARTPAQVQDNAHALAGDLPADLFTQMTAISNKVIPHIPDTGNQYRYYP